MEEFTFTLRLAFSYVVYTKFKQVSIVSAAFLFVLEVKHIQKNIDKSSKSEVYHHTAALRPPPSAHGSAITAVINNTMGTLRLYMYRDYQQICADLTLAKVHSASSGTLVGSTFVYGALLRWVISSFISFQH